MKKPIEYAHVDGCITLQWQDEGSRVGYIRVHADASKMPGPTLYTLVVEACADKTYEFKLLEEHWGGRCRGPTLGELKRFHRYMYSIGYTNATEWRRFKGSKAPKTVPITVKTTQEPDDLV